MNSFARSNQEFNPAHCLVQFVCFKTARSVNQFDPVWQPYASSLLRKGIEVLILNEAQESPTQSLPFRFMSQNCWPKRRFEDTFQNGQIAGNVTVGPVRMAQAGGFVFRDYTLAPVLTREQLFMAASFSTSVMDYHSPPPNSKQHKKRVRMTLLCSSLDQLGIVKAYSTGFSNDGVSSQSPHKSVERHSMYSTSHFVSLSRSVLQYVHCFVRWLSSSFDHHEYNTHTTKPPDKIDWMFPAPSDTSELAIIPFC